MMDGCDGAITLNPLRRNVEKSSEGLPGSFILAYTVWLGERDEKRKCLLARPEKERAERILKFA